MNQRQTDKVTAYQAVKLVLDDTGNQAIWSPHVAFSAAVTAFYGSLNVLAGLAQAQGVSLRGVSVDKERLAVSVINRTLIVAGAVAAYASVVNDRTLFEKANVQPSDLRNMRDADLDDAAQAQHDLAAGLLTPTNLLADYGMTTAVVADLQSAITAYAGAVASPRAAVAMRKSATDSIPDEFARADQILEERVDRLIPQFQAAHGAFVDAYFTARNIVQTGGGGGGGGGGGPTPPTVVPTAPQNVTVTAGAAGSGAATVDSDPPAAGEGVTSFRVFNNGTLVVEVPSLPTELTGFGPGESLYITVSAVNGIGEGPQSGTVGGQAG